jgi:hypothetical protein
MKDKVEAYNQDGKFNYSMSPTQYFLVTKDEVLTGIKGFTEFELQQQQGMNSDKEYETRKEELMKGNEQKTTPTNFV